MQLDRIAQSLLLKEFITGFILTVKYLPFRSIDSSSYFMQKGRAVRFVIWDRI